MNQSNSTPQASDGTSFRVLPGPVIEVYGPGMSAKVALTSADALAIVQALIFEVREQFYPLIRSTEGHAK